MIRQTIILLSLLLAAYVKTSFGQDKYDDIKLLKIACDNVIENQTKKGEQVIYIDRLSSWGWLINKINSQDTFGKQPKPIIVLTKKDKDSILAQIKAFEQFIWPDSLFENSKRIDHDSMWPLITRGNKNRFTGISYTDAQKDTVSNNKLKYKLSNVYMFSKLLYIREGSVALLGFGWMCGGECGHNEVAFYKKEHGRWKRWIIISGGDF